MLNFPQSSLAIYLPPLETLTTVDYVVTGLTILVTAIFFWQAWVAWKAVSK